MFSFAWDIFRKNNVILYENRYFKITLKVTILLGSLITLTATTFSTDSAVFVCVMLIKYFYVCSLKHFKYHNNVEKILFYKKKYCQITE